jgi:hypothetical protein
LVKILPLNKTKHIIIPINYNKTIKRGRRVKAMARMLPHTETRFRKKGEIKLVNLKMLGVETINLRKERILFSR